LGFFTLLRNKYKYLIRLCFTILTAIFIPVAIFSTIILRTSYKELIRKNEAYYSNIVNTYANYVENKILTMRSFAIDLSVKSNTTSYSVLNYADDARPYYYYKIVQLLSNQKAPDKSHLMLYFRNVDLIFTATHKYSLDEYVSRDIIKNNNLERNLRSFFNYDPNSKVTYFSTFNNLDYNDADFFIGIPVEIGVDQLEAMVVFMMKSDSIEASMFSQENTNSLQLLILNNDNSILYSNTFFEKALLADEEVVAFLSDNSITSFTKNNLTLFKSSTESNLKYIIVLPDDEITTDIKSFYKISIQIVILMFSILAIFLVGVIYINYRPIKKLANKFKRTRSAKKGDLAIIEETIQQIQSENLEQNIIIMDSLLNNILYGAPIPQTIVERYDFLNYSGGYCLLTIPNIILTTNQRDKIMTDILSDFHMKIYITEMLEERLTIILCLISTSSIDSILEYLHTYISEIYPKDTVEVFIGDIVDNVLKIRRSFIKCINKMGLPLYTPPDTLSENENSEKLDFKEKIISYITDNLTNPQLSQTMVADFLGISIYTLSRFFREQIGVGFTNYINAKRLDHAKQLLITTKMSIADIADAVGIGNANYFSTMFKSNCGITPGQFRENY
jgi:AraC-like DNA-binding protein